MNSNILPRFWLLLLCWFALGLPAHPQAVVKKSPPLLMETPPTRGTFYLLGRIPSPPFPFDPYHGTLPVFAYDGVFFVDDTKVSFLAQEFSFGSGFTEGGIGGGMMMAKSGPSLPGGPGGSNSLSSLSDVPCSLTNFAVSYRYAANGLVLGIAPTTNPWIALTIHSANINETFDIFGTTNLTDTATNLNRTNWVWLARISGGMTNFSWGLTNWC